MLPIHYHVRRCAWSSHIPNIHILDAEYFHLPSTPTSHHNPSSLKAQFFCAAVGAMKSKKLKELGSKHTGARVFKITVVYPPSAH
ncbi:hypothetical protein KCU62_g7785, partial [Aureobasidium sp. EXF-3399]